MANMNGCIDIDIDFLVLEESLALYCTGWFVVLSASG